MTLAYGRRWLQESGFWDAVRADPFSREEWLEAVAKAPGIKEDYFTVRALLEGELSRCFV